MANTKFVIGAVVAGVVIIGGFIGVSASVTKVKPGFAGVVYNTSGGIESQALKQGWHVITPWKTVTEYPVSTETVYLTKSPHEGSKNDDSFNVSTQEGKNVSVDAMYTYHMDINKLPEIFTKFRGVDSTAIESGFIKSTLKTTAQEIASTYPVLDVYGSKRDEITGKVSKAFTEKLAQYGIMIESFSFGEIRPDDATLKSIQAIVDQQNNIKQAELKKQQTQAEADQKRIEAQGNADKALIEAQGQAKANEVVKVSLTPELVQMEIAKKWDGKLPTVTGGNTPMIQLPQSTPSK